MTTSNGNQDPSTGRFLPGNRAARKHGLRARSSTELGRRDRRALGQASRLKTAFAEAGRPLDALALPLVTKWARLEVLIADRYAALQEKPENTRLFDELMAAMRLQVAVERELGMSPSTKASLGLAPTDDPAVLIAQARRPRLVAPEGAGGGAA